MLFVRLIALGACLLAASALCMLSPLSGLLPAAAGTFCALAAAAGAALPVYVALRMLSLVREAKEPRCSFRVFYLSDRPVGGAPLTLALRKLANTAGRVSVCMRVSTGAHAKARVQLYFTAPARAAGALGGLLRQMLPGAYVEERNAPAFPAVWRELACWRTRPARSPQPGGSAPAQLSPLCAELLRPLEIAAAVSERALLQQNERSHGKTVRFSRDPSPNTPALHTRHSMELDVRATLFPDGFAESIVSWHMHGTVSGEMSMLQGQADSTSPPEQRDFAIDRLRVLRSPSVFAGFAARIAVLALEAGFLRSSYAPAGTGREKYGARPTDQQADPHADPPSGLLCPVCLPATAGPYKQLSSVEARQIPLPGRYALPVLPEQVLVLGSSSERSTPVGIPLLRRVRTGGEGAGDRRPGQQAPGFELHPMIKENLLVCGGSAGWRNNIARSLEAQALEMGATVVYIEGAPGEGNSGSGHAPAAGLTSAERHPERQRPSFRAEIESPGGTHTAEDKLRRRNLNMLYMGAPAWLDPVEGEAVALLLALEAALPAQMRYMEGVGVLGLDAGSLMRAPGDQGEHGDQGDHREQRTGHLLLSAWLEVLLLRHHRARLLVAAGSRPHARSPRASRGAAHAAPHMSPHTANMSAFLPACPDLMSLAPVLDRPDLLIPLLRKERAAWQGEAANILRSCGGSGQLAMRRVAESLEMGSEVERIGARTLFISGASLLVQLERILESPSFPEKPRGLHASMLDFLGERPSHAHITLGSALSTPDYYGLYILWALQAASVQRRMLSLGQTGNGAGGKPVPFAPALLILADVAACTSPGSPFANSSPMPPFPAADCGIATTVLMPYPPVAGCPDPASFGNFVLGAAGRSLSASAHSHDAAQKRAQAVLSILSAVLSAGAAVPSSPQHHARAGEDSSEIGSVIFDRSGARPHAADLLDLLGRLDDSSALALLGAPGNSKALCTARINGTEIMRVRSAWHACRWNA